MNDRKTSSGLGILILFAFLTGPIGIVLLVLAVVFWIAKKSKESKSEDFYSPSASSLDMSAMSEELQQSGKEFARAAQKMGNELKNSFDKNFKAPEQDLFDNSNRDADPIFTQYSEPDSYREYHHVENQSDLSRYNIDRCDDREHRVLELKDLLKAGIIDRAEYNERLANL